MKKIYSLLLSLVMLSAFTACTNEVDDVFDQSSAERIASTIKNDTEILSSASNGWVMKFYADTQYGGYNVYCKFDADGNVSVENELYGDSIITSHYTLSQSQGVVLSFDTYNKFIHLFSDPDASVSGLGLNGKGMEGDFEFRVQSACADSVVLIGKKHESKVVMVPMPSDMDWKTYCSKVDAIQESFTSYSGYNLVIGGDSVKVSRKYRQLYFTDPESGNTIKMPYIITDKGIELYSPVTYNGATMRSFGYSDDGDMVSTDDNTVMLCPIVTLVSMLTRNDWYFARSGLTDTRYWDSWIGALYSDYCSMLGEVSFICFTPLSSNQLAFYWEFGGYYAYLTYNIKEVSDSIVTLQYAKTGDEYDNGTYLYSEWSWNYIVAPFSNKSFTISVDDVKNPTVLTLTQNSKPTNVITLTKKKVTDPFNN